MAWYENFLGKPWVGHPTPPETFNCGELVRYIHSNILGIDTANIHGNPNKLYDCLEAMAPKVFGLRPLDDDEKPQEYDTVFMARNKYDDHCGIGVQTIDGLLIMHCLRNSGVVLDNTLDLIGRGFKKLTWYRHLNMGETI
jgi:hypothetical protein